MPYYNSLGVEIVRIRSVFGKDVSELDAAIRSEVEAHGYVKANGMLVKGRLVTPSFDLPQILSTVFSSQNLSAGDKLDRVDEALREANGQDAHRDQDNAEQRIDGAQVRAPNGLTALPDRLQTHRHRFCVPLFQML